MVRQDNDASGQVGPKTKFKQDDEKPRLSGRRRADRTGTKLEKAKERLAARKPRRPPGLAKRRCVRYGPGHGNTFTAKSIRWNRRMPVWRAPISPSWLPKAARRLSRHVKKRWSNRPVRLVEKWERRHIRANAGWQFRQLTQEHPALKSNVFSRAHTKAENETAVCSKGASSGQAGSESGRAGPLPIRKRRCGPWEARLCGIRWEC